jgi:hypothetical protein
LGRADIENALKRLDSLIHEEVRMAIAQTMKATFDLRDGAKAFPIACTVYAELSSTQMPKEPATTEMKQSVVICHFHRLRITDTRRQGNRKIRTSRRWLSPPDPSTNHNTACEICHKGPPGWLFGSGIFKDWMSNGSLLWIHGKRTFISYS